MTGKYTSGKIVDPPLIGFGIARRANSHSRPTRPCFARSGELFGANDPRSMRFLKQLLRFRVRANVREGELIWRGPAWLAGWKVVGENRA